jgi:hypothetical protein
VRAQPDPAFAEVMMFLIVKRIVDHAIVATRKLNTTTPALMSGVFGHEVDARYPNQPSHQRGEFADSGADHIRTDPA